MAEITELADQLAAAVVVTSADDLAGLANIHTQLLALAEALPVGGRDQRQVAGKAERIVEQIVLREVTDTAAAMQDLSRTVTDLIAMINGAKTKSAAPANENRTRSAAPAATVPQGNHAKIEPITLNPDDLPLVNEFINEAQGHIESAEAAILKIEEDPGDIDAVNAIFRSFHTIKGVAGFLNLKAIGSLAHCAESLLDLARNARLKLTGGAVDVVLEAIDLMKALIAALANAATTGSQVGSDDRLSLLLDKLAACAAGKAVAPSAKPAAAPPRAPTPIVPPAPIKPAETSAKPATEPAECVKPDKQPVAAKLESAHSQDAFVKVSTERLDNLVNAIGELVIAQSMVRQDIAGLAGDNHRASRNLAHLGKIARELQDLSMSMRMVPIHGVFQRMARLTRDVARKAGKEIEFVQAGGETELDRTLVEAISDPLVHMVRNAADHGIEAPEVREKSGKLRTGRVELKAYHQAGSIVIEIKDDGKGLNKARILKKAVDAGIVQPDQELTDQEIFKLIFHAGLSTAEKITDISGRGVGMDVVKRNVETLRGRVEISSVEGNGSTFTIRLPLTLAVIDGLVVKVGAERFILPIMTVEQSVRPKASQLSTIQNRGEMCMIRESLLPLYRLHRIFNVTPTHTDPTEALVVVVQDQDRRCCLLVDELLGQQEVVIKSLGESLGNVRGVAGGAILGDGNVSLILDVTGLIDVASGKQE